MAASSDPQLGCLVAIMVPFMIVAGIIMLGTDQWFMGAILAGGGIYLPVKFLRDTFASPPDNDGD